MYAVMLYHYMGVCHLDLELRKSNFMSSLAEGI